VCFVLINFNSVVYIEYCLKIDMKKRWRRDYNEFRPHSALTYLTPAEFALKAGF